MDSTIINVRAFSWHFQVDRDTLRPSISRNDWHKANGWPSGYFSIYRLFFWSAL